MTEIVYSSCVLIVGLLCLAYVIKKSIEADIKGYRLWFMFKPLLSLDEDVRKGIEYGIRSGLMSMFIEGEKEYMLVDKSGNVYTTKDLNQLKELVEILEYFERKRKERDGREDRSNKI